MRTKCQVAEFQFRLFRTFTGPGGFLSLTEVKFRLLWKIPNLSIDFLDQKYANYFLILWSNFLFLWYVGRVLFNTQLGFERALKTRKLLSLNLIWIKTIYSAIKYTSLGFLQFFSDASNSIDIISSDFFHHYISKYFWSLVLFYNGV